MATFANFTFSKFTFSKFDCTAAAYFVSKIPNIEFYWFYSDKFRLEAV